MKRFLKLSCTIAVLLLAASCKDDELPGSRISFENDQDLVNESDGTPASFVSGGGHVVNIPIRLTTSLDEPAVIAYTIEGTATAYANKSGDFEIKGGNGQFTIPAGVTTASIPVTLYEDVEFEETETIDITLTSVVSGRLQLGNDHMHYILSIVEDDLLVAIHWYQTGVEMALLGWVNDPIDNPDQGFGNVPRISSTLSATIPGLRMLTIPAGYGDGEYGFSYVYYSGDKDNVAFDATFTQTVADGGKAFENTHAYLTVYGLSNLNKYTDVGAPKPKIIQTIQKSGIHYTNISDMTLPKKGS